MTRVNTHFLGDFLDAPLWEILHQFLIGHYLFR